MSDNSNKKQDSSNSNSVPQRPNITHERFGTIANQGGNDSKDKNNSKKSS